EGQAGKQTFGEWFGKHPVAWVTTGVAGVGFVGGVIFSIAAGAASGKTNDAADAIRAHLASSGMSGVRPCAPDGSGGADASGYEKACGILRDDISTFHTDVGLAVTGWVLFGVGAGVTATYALVDWYPHRKASEPTTGVRVVPVLAPGLQGLSVTGRF
ncbi:MAG TPA: hypothetical protein VHB21_10710, partial [Minicystis sp.]|nr:hypothetical protein [Minicystis sp.]